jgi:hypothetical protein
LFLQWSLGDGTSSSLARLEPTTVLFTAHALLCLNFSAGPHQTLCLSTVTSHGHFLSRYCGRLSQDFLSHDYSLFLISQSSLISNNRLLLKIVLHYCSMIYGGVKKNVLLLWY